MTDRQELMVWCLAMAIIAMQLGTTTHVGLSVLWALGWLTIALVYRLRGDK